MTNLNISKSTGNRWRFSRTVSSMALSGSGMALLAANEALATKLGATGAVNAYLAAAPALKDGETAKITGHMAANKTMHWTMLANARDEFIPATAHSLDV